MSTIIFRRFFTRNDRFSIDTGQVTVSDESSPSCYCISIVVCNVIVMVGLVDRLFIPAQMNDCNLNTNAKISSLN